MVRRVEVEAALRGARARVNRGLTWGLCALMHALVVGEARAEPSAVDALVRSPGLEREAAREHYALLVALRYEGTQWNVQPYAARDLADMLRSLKELGYRAENVHVLSDVGRAELGVDWDFNYVEWDASFPSESLRAKMFEVVAPARARDTVLFYFSGHGMSEKDARLFATPRSAPSLWTTFLDVPPAELLPDSPPDGPYRALLVVDACATRGAGLLAAGVRSRSRRDVYALYSSVLGAKSCWDDGLKMSVFTYYLAQGLRDTRDVHGGVSVAALASYLLRTVPRHEPNPNCLERDPFANADARYQLPEVSEAEDFELGGTE